MDKFEVLNLKNSGMSYAEIAHQTGVNISTVKSMIRRARLKKTAPDVCKYCGKKLTHVPGKKRKMFCNVHCRTTYHRLHQNEGTRNKAIYVCPVCGKEFKDYASRHPKYCSLECYWKRGCN